MRKSVRQETRKEVKEDEDEEMGKEVEANGHSAEKDEDETEEVKGRVQMLKRSQR